MPSPLVAMLLQLATPIAVEALRKEFGGLKESDQNTIRTVVNVGREVAEGTFRSNMGTNDGEKPITTGHSLPPGYASPHFRYAEFACNHCGKMPVGCPPEQLLAVLEATRAHFGGTAVNINSGYRCPQHNTNVGGASQSRHMEGDAADFWIDGVSPQQIYAFLDPQVQAGGLHAYDTFTHVDTRGYRARW